MTFEKNLFNVAYGTYDLFLLFLLIILNIIRMFTKFCLKYFFTGATN